METISAILFYILFSSSVLVYGIGALAVAEQALSTRPFFLSMAESYFCVAVVIPLSFLIMRFLLLPLGIDALYPLVALLFFVSISVFFEVIVQVTIEKSGASFAVPYLAIILALCEGGSLANTLIIGLSALTSYYALIPLLRSFAFRSAMQKKTDYYTQTLCIFFSMLVLMLALYSLSVSFLFLVL